MDVIAMGNDACSNLRMLQLGIGCLAQVHGTLVIVLYFQVCMYEKGLTIEKQSMSNFPIWLKVWNIPLDFSLSVDGISYVASGVGIPFCLDKATEERKRIDFAKVCVEEQYSNVLPDFIEVEVEGAEPLTANIEYPWNHKDVHLVMNWVIMLSFVQS